MISKKDFLGLSVLLLLGLALRLHHLDFLIPYFEYSDENDLVKAALRIVQTGDLNPHFYSYGSFPIYWTALLYDLVLGARCLSPALGINWVGGEVGTIGECIRNFGINDQGFLLLGLGRFTSILFGLGTIVIAFILARRIWGRGAGYISALFLTVAPFHIFFSQVFKVDISLAFWMLLVVYFSLDIYERGSIGSFLWAGLAAGLVMSTKYNFLILLPFLLAPVLRSGWEGLFSWKVLIGGYLAAMVFVLTCPYSVLDFRNFYHQLTVQMNVNQQFLWIYRYDPASFFHRRFFYQIFLIFPAFFGPIIYVASAYGFFLLVRKDWRLTILLLSFPVAYFFFTAGVSELVPPQYQLPYLFFFVILGTQGMLELWKSAGWRRGAGGALLVLSLIFFLSDLWIPHFQGQFGVYQKAGRWIDREIPKDKPVLDFFWQVPATGHFRFAREEREAKADRLSVARVREANPDYLILTDSQIFKEPRCPCHFEGYLELLDWLFYGEGRKEYYLVKEFRLEPTWEWLAGKVYRQMQGFRITVWSRREAADSKKSPPGS
ncbi:MAG: glycosyltransferase family 39 protein [bacterium]|nr:glycosyltransferase family 39 protein [bacterium]